MIVDFMFVQVLDFPCKSQLEISSSQVTSNSLVKSSSNVDFGFLQSLLCKHVTKLKSHYLNLQSLQLRKTKLILVNVFLSCFSLCWIFMCKYWIFLWKSCFKFVNTLFVKDLYLLANRKSRCQQVTVNS